MMVSAYVPCYDNDATLRRSVEGVLAQSRQPDEVLVVDDGSMVPAGKHLAGLPVRVIRHERNLGRGATRARAMEEARGDLVLCCDATNVLVPSFLERALDWFDEARIAGVFGRIDSRPTRGVVERWRARHLFKVDAAPVVRHGTLLATSAALLRASAVRTAGGFDRGLRHSEDADLGQRLLSSGFDVVCDPRLAVTSIARNSLGKVLERYWRWHAGSGERVSIRGYWRAIGFSVKVLAAADLRARDPLGVPISLVAPHFQFWRSALRRMRKRGEAG